MSQWTMMFAEAEVEEKLERWSYALQKRGRKISPSKTEYLCVNERDTTEQGSYREWK